MRCACCHVKLPDVVYFSSAGPADDGRIKPDIVSPGAYIISAKSVGYSNTSTCRVHNMEGTSMATPALAGSAALVRQYYMDGFYASHAMYVSTALNWDCIPGYMCSAYEPSGVLVKATLIHSTVEMTGWDNETFVPLSSPPDYNQGFGRVALNSTLLDETMTPTLTGGRMGMYFDDSSNISAWSSMNYTVHVTSSMYPLKVCFLLVQCACVCTQAPCVCIREVTVLCGCSALLCLRAHSPCSRPLWCGTTRRTALRQASSCCTTLTCG